MDTGIKDTSEVIEAIAALAARTIANLKDDGKISIGESFGYFAEFSNVISAIKGIGNLRAEIMDLDENEIVSVHLLIESKLESFGPNPRNRDIAARVLTWIFSTADMIQDIRHQPPMAIKV